MIVKMDDDFRILFDYVEQMKREVQDEADLQTKSAEDEEKKCVHAFLFLVFT